VVREAYFAHITQVWYHAIDMHCILFRVDFKVTLSSSILKIGQLITKISKKVLKKSTVFKPRPLTHHMSHPFKLSWAKKSVKACHTGACHSFRNEWNIFKEKSHGDGSK
jgi:hypothetical protein